MSARSDYLAGVREYAAAQHIPIPARGTIPRELCQRYEDWLARTGARTGAARYTVVGDTWVNMNGSHGNPYAHQSLMNRWKYDAGLAIIAARCLPVAEPVVITATVRRTRDVPADAHNVTPTIKACIDAAVSAALISDDNDAVVRQLVTQGGPVAGCPTVHIDITTWEPV